MDYIVPPTKSSLKEALKLSEEIIRNIELDELTVVRIYLKVSRLARLLNDFDMIRVIEYENSGYPTSEDGKITREGWKLALKANRRFINDNGTEVIYTDTVGQFESELEMSREIIKSTKDPNISISSANPHNYLFTPQGNMRERVNYYIRHRLVAERLNSRREFIYRYTLSKSMELRFSKISDDVFSRIRIKVDGAIGSTIPDSINKFVAIYDNLKSENPEDWSNAVHSCRRIIEDLADSLFPPMDDTTKMIDGKERVIKLGKGNYINRLLEFSDQKSSSSRFKELFGSHLRFLDDRLNSVWKASQKGTHATILRKDEADRYVIYAYLLIGDILSLLDDEADTKSDSE